MTIREDTTRDIHELISSIQDAHKALLIIGEKISKKTFEEKSMKLSAVVSIYSDIVETIDASLKLCIDGYYESSIKLLRSCFEGCFMINKLYSYPEDSFKLDKKLLKEIFEENGENNNFGDVKRQYEEMVDSDKKRFEINLWLDVNNEFNKQKMICLMKFFSPVRMIKKFSTDNLTAENLKAYHKLSQFSHPFFGGLISRYHIKEGYLKFSPSYKKEFAESVLKEIFKMIVTCSNSVRIVFPHLVFSEEEGRIIDNAAKKYDEFV